MKGKNNSNGNGNGLNAEGAEGSYFVVGALAVGWRGISKLSM